MDNRINHDIVKAVAKQYQAILMQALPEPATQAKFEKTSEDMINIEICTMTGTISQTHRVKRIEQEIMEEVESSEKPELENTEELPDADSVKEKVLG